MDGSLCIGMEFVVSMGYRNEKKKKQISNKVTISTTTLFS